MARRLAPRGEDALIAWLRRLPQAGDAAARPGDDAALLPAAGELAVTVDHQIEGIHFPASLDPALVARRLLAVSLSDLAAVGALPRYAFLALAGPLELDRRRLLRSLVAACREHGVTLAGGDLARSPVVSLALTLLGELPPRGRWLRRGNARPGDRLWLGGTLGESAAGRWLIAAGARPVGRGFALPEVVRQPPRLRRAAVRALRRHLAPRPQLALGRWLGTLERAAAIDVSDGLGLDLERLCRESGAGARVRWQALPIPAHLGALAAALGHDLEELVLTGGEDYVLLFTLPPGTEPPADFACRAIGEIVAGATMRLDTASGSRPLPIGGWDHLRAAP